MFHRFALPALLFLAGFGTAQSSFAAAITPSTNWYQFSFTQTQFPAQGCFPADPGALDCDPSTGGNSIFAPAAPWTFTFAAGGGFFVVTDAFLRGDSFQIFDFGASIGNTPAVAAAGGCGSDPAVCLADPLVSHASFLLGAGAHSITIEPNTILDPGSGYFLLSRAPEPSTALLAGFGIAFCLIVAHKRRKARVSAPLLTFLVFGGFLLSGRAQAQNIANDASPAGPLAVQNTEFYRFAATCDDQVLPCTGVLDTTKFIELWGQVYRPQNLTAGPYPLIILLHGNHGTCGRPAVAADRTAFNVGAAVAFRVDDNTQYTTTGTCPVGYVVTPNHLGYAYFANRLASWGYIVVSINANRGITAGAGVAGDVWLIFARARLVLRHLQLLNQWTNGNAAQTPPNTEGSSLPATLNGKIDFGNVGLLGHSRGGEGVRAAYALLRDGDPRAGAPNWSALIPGLSLKGVFEVAPTDFGRIPGSNGAPLAPAGPVDVDGLTWNVLLPMCDGDVAGLSGIRPFDRILLHQLTLSEVLFPRQKSTYQVWGANHNFYNTEWQTSDAMDCLGVANAAMFPGAPGSPSQRLTGLSSVLAFFRGTVGNNAQAGAFDATFNQNFNPLFRTPPTVVSEANAAIAHPRRVERGFTPSPSRLVSRIFDDFDRATGTNTYNIPNDRTPTVSVAHIDGDAFTEFDPTPCPPAVRNFLPNHDPSQRAASISWPAAGGNVYFQTNWTALNAPGANITALPLFGQGLVLSFRVARRVVISAAIPLLVLPPMCVQPPSTVADPLNVGNNTDFSIRLVGANGVLTRTVRVSTYLPGNRLTGPVGGSPFGAPDSLRPILQTVRIPISDFGNVQLVQQQLRGVRFLFDQTASGAIYLGNVRLENTLGVGVGILAAHAQADTPTPDGGPGSPARPVYAGTITNVTAVSSSAALNGDPGVEIRISSLQPFLTQNEVLVLRIGSASFMLSRYENGNNRVLIFTLTQSEYTASSAGATAVVQYGLGNGGLRWDLGPFGKPF